jgi:hypothetical protein
MALYVQVIEFLISERIDGYCHAKGAPGSVCFQARRGTDA